MRRRREFPGASAYYDRHGVRRWRYRSKGFSAELGTDYGSPEFVRRYEDALARKRGGGSLPHGSIAWLVASYYRTPDYRNLSPQTRRVYRGVLEKFREAHGAKMAATLQRQHVLKLIGAKAETPHAANFLLRMIRLLMAHAVEVGLRTDDPTLGVKKFSTAGDGFHTWDEGEIARFYEMHALGSTAHLAMTLMLYTGAARVDAVRLGWGNIGRDGRLRYRREKTKRKTPVLIDIPVHPELEAALALVPRDRFTFLQTSRGEARSPNGLGNSMRRWCDAAGLPECTSHGLRKACARRLAEAGATPNMIAAVTGHTTLKEVSRYTAAANRTGLADAGFALLSDWTEREQTLTNHPARFVKSERK